MPAQCINLKDRKDRWDEFRSQEPARALRGLRRFPAFNGRTLHVREDPRISVRTKLNILRNYRRSHQEIATIGAVGCSLSHMGVWKAFLASGQPYAMVFEDDAVLQGKVLEKVQAAAAHLPHAWGIWLLGCYLPNLVVKPLGSWQQVQNFTASHAQILTRAAAKKLLEQALPIENHVDHYMAAASIVKEFPIVQKPSIHVSWRGAEHGNKDSNTSQKQQKKDGCPVCKISDDFTQMQQGVPDTGGVTVEDPIAPKSPMRVQGLAFKKSSVTMKQSTRKNRRKD